MPVLVAALATFVSLVLSVAIRYTHVPAAPYFAVAAGLAMAAAALLLRSRHRLFLPAGVLFLLEAFVALGIVLFLPLSIEVGKSLALVFTLLSLAGVVATVLFLVALADVTRADARLRLGLLIVAAGVVVSDGWQVVMNVSVLTDVLREPVINAGLAIVSSPLWILPVLVDAAMVLTLLLAWLRFFTPTSRPTADAETAA